MRGHMGAQDKTEQVLRDIHILLSKGEAYQGNPGKVIIDKKEMIGLLKRLNTCIYEIMDEHELTVQSRDAAEREVRRKTEAIVTDAGRKAEDVYAASILYSDEALRNVCDIMQDACDAMHEIYEKMDEALKKEKREVRRDQSDLRRSLEELKDSKKYLDIIEDRNRQREREKAKQDKDAAEVSAYAAIKPEIKVNQEYFEKAGLVIVEDESEQTPPEEKKSGTPDVTVNLDAEYFKRKNQSGEEKSPEEKKKKKKFF